MVKTTPVRENRSKQPKLQHYWLNKLPESANRFSILDIDNELSNEDECQEEEVLKTQNDPKPPPIYVFKVELELKSFETSSSNVFCKS